MRGYVMPFSPGHAGVAANGKTAIFNDKVYVQAYQWRHDAIFKDHFFPDRSAQNVLNNNGTSNTFAAGRVAMSLGHSWALDGLQGVKFKWVAAVPPVAPNGKLTARINADTFAILQKSKNKDAAWKVLKWLTSSEIASQVCAIYGCLPARVSARADWEKQIKTTFPDLDVKIIYGAVKYLDNPNSEAPMPNYSQASDTLDAFVTEVDSNPDLDVKAALDKLNTQEQSIFDGKAPTPTPEPAATEAATAAATQAK